MKEVDQKAIFANNLNRLLNERNLTQLEVAKAIGVSAQTFNTWCKGIAIPRMDKIQRLSDYFRVNKSCLIDELSSSSDSQAVTPADPGEARLLYLYRGLNSIGQTKLNEYAEDLSANEKYQLHVYDGVSESSITYKDSVDYSDLPMVAEEQAKYGEEAI